MKDHQDRFIEGFRHYMAEHSIAELKQMAPVIDIPYATIFKIMKRDQNVTIDHCLNLLRIGNYSAEWLFLGRGVMKAKEQVVLNDIYSMVKDALPKTLPAKKKKG